MKDKDIAKSNLNFYDKEFKEKGDTRQAIGSSLYNPCFQVFRQMLKNQSLILDQGCGTGYYTEILLADGHYVEGFDISPEAIKKCEEYFTSTGFKDSQYKLWIHDYLTFEYPKSKYDGIMDRYSLHFIPFEKQKIVLESVYGALKSGGLFHLGVMLEGCFETWKDPTFKFTKKGGHLFKSKEEDEYRCWYLWDSISLRSILTKLGFEIIYFHHPFTYIEFVCQKLE